MKMTSTDTRPSMRKKRVPSQRRQQASISRLNSSMSSEKRSVHIQMVTLHVGTGTFRPVKTELVEDHYMDRESFEIASTVIAEIEKAKQSGRRVITVGTTSTRTLKDISPERVRAALKTER